MPVAKSVHFGLNSVNPQHYQGWNGRLGGQHQGLKGSEFVTWGFMARGGGVSLRFDHAGGSW